MAEYKLIITVPALEDINSIRAYIAGKLDNPSAAQKFSDKIFSSASSLALLPKRYRIRRKDRKGHEIRYMPSDNFMIMYCVDDDSYTVSVIRVAYAGRDIDFMFQL